MRLHRWLVAPLICLAIGCADEDMVGPAPPEDALPPDSGPEAVLDMGDLGTAADAALALPRTYRLTLDAGAFAKTPEHPSALLYVPRAFVPSPATALVVYLHGFNNCVDNIVRPTADAQPCTKGGAARNAYNLIGQLEDSGRNALLLCPEVAFDQASSDPGRLGTAGGFHALVAEALAQVSKDLGPIEVDHLGPVILASHSGGYAAAAAMAVRGGLKVSELYLLDSLYGNSADFESWIKQDLGSFSGAAPRRRFATVYTDTGGTLMNNQLLATRAAGFGLDPGVIVDDRTTSTWPPETYQHGLLFKRSMLAHDGVPRYYFGTLISTSSLPQHLPMLWAAAEPQ